jgi:hypothetical protein
MEKIATRIMKQLEEWGRRNGPTRGNQAGLRNLASPKFQFIYRHERSFFERSFQGAGSGPPFMSPEAAKVFAQGAVVCGLGVKAG